MKRLYIIGSDKGGVGKTETALSAIYSLRKEGVSLGIGEADRVRRLSSVLGDDVDVSLSVSEDLLTRLEQPGEADSFFAPLLAVTEDADAAVLDLGASISGQMLNWMAKHGITQLLSDEGWQPVFLAVTAPENAALQGAIEYLQAAHTAAGEAGEYALIQNDLVGSGFAFLEGDGFRRAVQSLRDRYPLHQVTLPHARDISIVRYSRNNGLSLSQAYHICYEITSLLEAKTAMPDDIRAVADAIGVTDKPTVMQQKLAIRQQLRDIEGWMLACGDALSPILRPAEVEGAHETPEADNED